MTCFEFLIGEEPESLRDDTFMLVVCKGMSTLAIRSPRVSWRTFTNIIKLVKDLREWLLKKIADEKLYGAYYELKLILIFTPNDLDPLSYKMLTFAETVTRLPIKVFVGFQDIHADFAELFSIPGLV